MDHQNSVTSRGYVKDSKRSFLGIANIDAAVISFQKASDSHIVCALFAVLDFKAAFANIAINPGPHMSANIIEITVAGIRSKQDPAEPWNKWFGGNEEDFHRIVPVGTVLPVVQLAPSQGLDMEHLKTIKSVVSSVHLLEDPFWKSIFGGGVGGAPNVVPFDLNALPRRFGDHVAVAGVPENVVDAPEQEEILTESVFDHGPSDVYDGEYTFHVKYSDGDIKWANLDDLVDPDFTINACLLQYLAPHPQIKKKGILLMPLSQVMVLTFLFAVELSLPRVVARIKASRQAEAAAALARAGGGAARLANAVREPPRLAADQMIIVHPAPVPDAAGINAANIERDSSDSDQEESAPLPPHILETPIAEARKRRRTNNAAIQSFRAANLIADRSERDRLEIRARKKTGRQKANERPFVPPALM
jgi:hypothetical protein